MREHFRNPAQFFFAQGDPKVPKVEECCQLTFLFTERSYSVIFPHVRNMWFLLSNLKRVCIWAFVSCDVPPRFLCGALALRAKAAADRPYWQCEYPWRLRDIVNRMSRWGHQNHQIPRNLIGDRQSHCDTHKIESWPRRHAPSQLWGVVSPRTLAQFYVCPRGCHVVVMNFWLNFHNVGNKLSFWSPAWLRNEQRWDLWRILQWFPFSLPLVGHLFCGGTAWGSLLRQQRLISWDISSSQKVSGSRVAKQARPSAAFKANTCMGETW